jgi:hypothetical protein
VLPVVVRTTDEMLRLVPSQMREAALSLGIPQWKVIVQVLYRSASAGIVTGILLALARISAKPRRCCSPPRQPVLEQQHVPADGLGAGGDLPVRRSPYESGRCWPGPVPWC